MVISVVLLLWAGQGKVVVPLVSAASVVRFVSNSDEFKMAGLWLEVEGLWRHNKVPRMSGQSLAVSTGLGLQFAQEVDISTDANAPKNNPKQPSQGADSSDARIPKKGKEAKVEKTLSLLNNYQRKFCVFSSPQPFDPSTQQFFKSFGREIRQPSSAWFGDQFTLEFWFHLDASQPLQRVRVLTAYHSSRKDKAKKSGFFLDLTKENLLRFGSFDKKGEQNITTTFKSNSLTSDSWVHIAVVKQGLQVNASFSFSF